jgi:transcriptional regulator with XRE-family HTH domain
MTNTEFAEVMKNLRCERGISRKKLADGLCNADTIRNYENGHSTPSFELVLKLLNRMNVTLSDFLHKTDTHEFGQKEKYAKIAQECIRTGGMDETTYDDFQNKFEETGDFYYYLMFYQMLMVLAKKSGSFHDEAYQEPISRIKKYLEGIETWGELEQTIFINLIFIWSDDFIQMTYEKQFVDKKHLHKKSLILLENAVTLSLENGSGAIDYYLSEFEKLIVESKDVYFKMLYEYFNAIQWNNIKRACEVINDLKKYGFDRKSRELEVFLLKQKILK